MPVESAEDRAAMIEPNEFGVRALWKGLVWINGIFDRPYLELPQIDAAGVASRQPTFTYREADALDMASGDTLHIDGVKWLIAAVPEVDGTGMATAPLHRSG